MNVLVSVLNAILGVCSLITGRWFRGDSAPQGLIGEDGMTTPTIDRCKEVNYGPRDDDGCRWHCAYSRTAQYVGGGTKFVCDRLGIQVHKGDGCNQFSYRRDME